jgi:hypothetical protein
MTDLYAMLTGLMGQADQWRAELHDPATTAERKVEIIDASQALLDTLLELERDSRAGPTSGDVGD